MPRQPSEQRFGPLVFELPVGYAQVDDRVEEIPSRIPGARPTREHFRSYTAADGSGIYLFHWVGLPQRDRGPMKASQGWEVSVGGQPGKLSLTEIFFGHPLAALVAHFKTPTGEQCLIYQRTADPKRAPERGPFEALLASVRFEPESIGSATMLPDGTIQLQLRATDGRGAVGDALLSYPRSHPDYQKILEHLGGLEPGEHKPVRPFPDQD